GSADTIVLYTASGVVSSEVTNGLSKAIPRARLEALKDNTDITVELKVTFDKTSTEANAVTFPLRTYTVKAFQVVTPTIDMARDAKPAPIAKSIAIPNGGVTMSTTVTLTGKASRWQKVKILDGLTDKGDADVNGNGDWRKTLTGLSVAAHNFTARGLYGSTQPESAPYRIEVLRIKENFETIPVQKLVTGRAVTTPSQLTVTQLKNDFEPSEIFSAIGPPLEPMQTRACLIKYHSTVSFRFPGTSGWTRVWMMFGFVNSPSYEIARFYNPAGQQIGTLNIPACQGSYEPMVFTASTGQRVAQVTVGSEYHTLFLVDNFGWE
ncbi:hypothetical protein, partial [Burkholderia ubonensis]|uniref:hypothetical protein n=1 Tax=Burkholderia ubonensis TaxID=101571 RepID=UPI0007556E43